MLDTGDDVGVPAMPGTPSDLPVGVRLLAESGTDLPAYLYDLPGLAAHVAAVRSALAGVELFYAVKANPDPALLRVLSEHVDGFDVASVGELARVRGVAPRARIAYGGPGKTDAELELARDADYLHVESPNELARLVSLGGRWDVLLRINSGLSASGARWAMNGPTPFGMDPADITLCLRSVRASHAVHVQGLHAHPASGLPAQALLDLAQRTLDHARALGLTTLNLGGGAGVSYERPGTRFDWQAYGRGLRSLRRPSETLRVEPGRSLTAYCGWYLTQVIDVKRVHGHHFAVLTGGTHHLRTPAVRRHSQPFTIVPTSKTRLAIRDEPVTLVGQLCTPSDVLAGPVHVDQIAVGDVVVFAMAGAYAWNISHHEFLMHPPPAFHYLLS